MLTKTTTTAHSISSVQVSFGQLCTSIFSTHSRHLICDSHPGYGRHWKEAHGGRAPKDHRILHKCVLSLDSWNTAALLSDGAVDIFLPGDPEIRESVGGRIGFDLLSANKPIIGVNQMEKITGPNDEEALLVLKQVNARKPLVGLYGALDSIRGENIAGFVAQLELGSVGLRPATVA